MLRFFSLRLRSESSTLARQARRPAVSPAVFLQVDEGIERRDGPEVLVLDEATSSLDTAIELEVMQAVSTLRGSKTIVIVAHRLTTVEHCTRLYRLEYGRVAETETPQTMRVGEFYDTKPTGDALSDKLRSLHSRA